MDITTRFASVVDWLEKCVQGKDVSHQKCFRIQVLGFPSRLIDLKDYLTSGSVRLVETQGWQPPLPEYTTLSHCWGPPDGPRTLRTTLSNLEAHKIRIFKGELPATFRDAIEITLRVGISFIWIDSLAIIQDDQQDWESEAANMAAIYENSFLTIAATSSENCMGGCDLEPWCQDIVKATATTGSKRYHQPILSNTSYYLKLKNTSTSWKDGSTRIPLHTRGWTLQEAMLSRRVLHMSTHHMLWHCRSVFDQEDVDAKKKWERSAIGFLWNELGDSAHHQSFWDATSQKYSTMLFTHISDRVPAIAGIINDHAVNVQNTPLLGLWKETLAQDLSWYSRYPQRARIPGLPTWTWLSHAGAIELSLRVYRSETRLLLDSWDIQWERQPYVSKLVTGVLNVSTKIIKAKTENFSYDKDTVRARFEALYAGKHVKVSLHCYPDTSITDDRALDLDLTFMLLSTFEYSSADPPSMLGYATFLMLHPSPDNPSAHVRLGLGEVFFFLEGSSAGEKFWKDTQVMDTLLEDWEDAKIQLC